MTDASARQAPQGRGALGRSGRALFGGAPPWLRALILAQVVALCALAITVAAGATIWNPVDERAHVAYVQEIADAHRLPVLGSDCVSDALHGLQPGGPWTTDRLHCGMTLGAGSYEAFQPPLYYLIAAPVYALTPGTRAKVYALRGLDVVLLLASIAALWWLATEVLGRHRAYGVALGLCVLAIPSVTVRQVTVSNAALELPITAAFLAAGWRANARRGNRRALGLAAVLLGLALLTKLTLIYLCVPFAFILLRRVLARGRGRAGLRDLALGCVVPLVLLAPWVALNEHRYHSTTADQRAQIMQAAYVNPYNVRYRWRDVEAYNKVLVAGYLPQECNVPHPNDPNEPLTSPVAFALVAVGLLGWLVMPRRMRLTGALFLLSPLLLDVLTLDITFVSAQQPVLVSRYLHSALLPFAVGIALMFTSGRKLRLGLGPLAAALTIILVVLWTTTALPMDVACTARSVLE